MPIRCDRWSPPKIPLLAINQHFTQPLTVTFAFHSFGNCEHTKVIRNRPKWLYHNLIVGISRHIFGELPINLDDIKRKVARLTEGRLTSTKIIKGKRDPALSQVTHEVHHQFGH